ALSNALKPLMQAGEQIKIKIQRYGKEPRQGVGYLEDGTMVVVNGGGDFIGEVIDAQVLSVKHTSSGRMIFCNAFDHEGCPEGYDPQKEEEYEDEPDDEY
nr:putative PIN and TRAM-domain containing protein YacL [Candidatus Anoxychlamydiales bacterium]